MIGDRGDGELQSTETAACVVAMVRGAEKRWYVDFPRLPEGNWGHRVKCRSEDYDVDQSEHIDLFMFLDPSLCHEGKGRLVEFQRQVVVYGFANQ
ncbi:hypothetical protein BG28_08575 [Nesterenkonia sp. AN1]|uniref:Uncharacterized protein n=1 Tax=Nesterenkonia aurantiaca TaxID=1436010 RepID=A0A4R7G663_9MICC|nr:hypothetical protein BG28_08575 [Nesterenkonia sp. AN1]TDS86964.1 hypothetical protein EV640_102259 [Nesterenkonia aurantiaca]